MVNKIQIDNAKFFLEIRKTKQKNLYNLQSREFEDNLGIAQKITTNAPDKVWPKKKKDINFLIKKSNLNNIKTNIFINNKMEEKDIILSQMTFSNFGNEKGYQHYKDVFKFIFFDIYGRISNFEIKKKIKNIYGL